MDMSEMPKHHEVQAVSDAVELAFWGVDFEECTNDLLSWVPEGEEGNVFDCWIREKSGYDALRGCNFTAAHVRGVLHDLGYIENADMVIVFWDDGMKVGVSVKDLFTEQRIMDTSGKNEIIPHDDASLGELHQSVKSALAQLIDLAS